ncbi:DUF1850 domain-containing protein [Brucella pituitosa]|uniref:DUF1850 domain-containing protein n=1 Tax=Brucella pituitosa TaxID=571256 RepID=A0A643EWR3_9HYPH|nr:DUF1850 domain-containing protein [Brucella pituitosa]PQZ50140.1 hypothetical protein CQZ90_05820 [Ochrobactrum sp. MYb19]PRA55107.1 hypothetical protein CQ062_09360 [Ochrobactrum sp. MYb68]PRA68181.1 hypothetical protein CQ053_00810 [Ochrobactrum sp. MYb18]PRA74592.1 hypothetical protein CQ049_15270 [Brucella thiophenivorans]PRA84527.1 hypothetical protein CQ054_15830 [Ochrobactrum sp. MYb29]PRA90432.1 hypothetical protein CQ051_10715 [Ochrobactrum sp. MYb14]PRA95883.1 hypothetical prote
MAICIATAGGVLKVAATSFLLSWTHSVEKIPWEESWTVTSQGLVLSEARIKGSGAGMDPPADAVLEDGWYHYRPHIPPRQEIVLAASGKTGGGWTFCAAQKCIELGKEQATPIHIKPCD